MGGRVLRQSPRPTTEWLNAFAGAPLMLEVSSATGMGREVYFIPTTMESGPTGCSR
jgi:hypothetical protein